MIYGISKKVFGPEMVYHMQTIGGHTFESKVSTVSYRLYDIVIGDN